MKEKRPTISPNFNFLGQLLDFEKKIKNQSGQPGHISKLTLLHLEKSSEHVLVPEGGHSNLSTNQLCITATSEIVEQKPMDSGSTSCAHLPSLEDGPLVQGINGLHVSLDKVEDSNRLKRSFSLDIKSVSYSASSSCVAASVQGFASSEDTLDYYKHATALEGSSKLCQFSPVQEVSEQTPEASPDKEEADPPKKPQNTWQLDSQSKRQHVGRAGSSTATQRSLLYPLHRSGSVEDNYRTNFVFGLSTSQQHLAKSAAGMGLKGWHSDILAPQTSAPSLTNSWYFAAESSHFYSASAIYGNSAAYSAYSCSQLPTGCDQACAVRRRPKQGDRGDSRRSWHEESSFEKQFKRRSCQMEFGESIMSDNRSREELGKVGSQSSFSGSMEIIEVSWGAAYWRDCIGFASPSRLLPRHLRGPYKSEKNKHHTEGGEGGNAGLHCECSDEINTARKWQMSVCMRRPSALLGFSSPLSWRRAEHFKDFFPDRGSNYMQWVAHPFSVFKRKLSWYRTISLVPLKHASTHQS